jgi:hypothetical protein
MPVKMISEMPLPIPRSEICSPSHMMNTVPHVKVRTVIARKAHPGWKTTAAPLGASSFSIPTLMKSPCTIESSTVPLRVYWVILRRPASPSFERRSRNGMTTVKSCKIIDALM